MKSTSGCPQLPLTTRTKIRIYKTVIRPILMYAQMWTITFREEKLLVTEKKITGKILGLKIIERVKHNLEMVWLVAPNIEEAKTKDPPPYRIVAYRKRISEPRLAADLTACPDTDGRILCTWPTRAPSRKLSGSYAGHAALALSSVGDRGTVQNLQL